MFLLVVEAVILAAFVILLLTQVVIPAIKGQPLFQMFRKKNVVLEKQILEEEQKAAYTEAEEDLKDLQKKTKYTRYNRRKQREKKWNKPKGF